MSANAMIRSYSDEALNGAIASLELSSSWWKRFDQLLREKKRRERLGIRIPQAELLFP